ncbi:MAG TPA: cytochrome P450 [Acidimicrobiia bacterium]|nr:cytochrome P450 [Acidimicrobiia bacterium]
MTDVPTREDLSANLLLDPVVIDDPYPLYRRLVEDAPVWHVPGTDIVLVSSFDAVAEATIRIDDFSSNIRGLLYRNDDGLPEVLPFGIGDGTDSLATADPPSHTAHRGTVFPELVARRMAALRPDIEKLADEHIGHALRHSSPEFMHEVANAIPIRVVSELIGFRDEDPEQLLEAAFDSTAMLSATSSLDEITARMERSATVMIWIADQLQHAIDDGRDGLLGTIGAAVNNGDLDFNSGLVIMHTLLSAGGESTTGLLGNAVHMLARRPELQDRLRAEPALLTPFIEEALRLESPFRYHLRHTYRTTELRGVTIPAGATVLLMWGAANRDPAAYDRADDVVLDRTAPRHHLAFGRGIHLCVGAPLARLEAEIVLGTLLERTAQFALDPERPAVRVPSLMVRRFETLPLVATACAARG